MKYNSVLVSPLDRGGNNSSKVKQFVQGYAAVCKADIQNPLHLHPTERVKGLNDPSSLKAKKTSTKQ